MNDVKDVFEDNRLRLKALVKELATEQGLCSTILDGVKLARTDKPLPRTQVLYEPSVYIVASGKKIGFVAERKFVYDTDNYLLLAVPLPFEVTTEVGNGEPMLGLSVRVDMPLVTELAGKMELGSTRRDDVDMIATIQPCPLDIPMS